MGKVFKCNKPSRLRLLDFANDFSLCPPPTPLYDILYVIFSDFRAGAMSYIS